MIEPVHHGSSSILLVHFLGHPVEEHNFFAKYRWSRSQGKILSGKCLDPSPLTAHYIDREKIRNDINRLVAQKDCGRVFFLLSSRLQDDSESENIDIDTNLFTLTQISTTCFYQTDHLHC